jgi:hypothetical protein
LPLSFVVATAPIATVLVTLGILRRPAWQASLAGLAAGVLAAVALWHFPAKLALAAAANGAAFGLIPLMWIVFNAILLYNVAVKSGSFDAFRDWILDRLPNDRRVVLVVVGFCFGALIEGVAGFGTPVAITSSLLALMGFVAARCARLRADLQHRPRHLFGAGRTDQRSRDRHPLAGFDVSRDGGPSTAIVCAHPALLRDGDVRRVAIDRGVVAGAARRGRDVCGDAVRGLEFHQLRFDRRACVARVAHGDALFSAPLAAG